MSIDYMTYKILQPFQSTYNTTWDGRIDGEWVEGAVNVTIDIQITYYGKLTHVDLKSNIVIKTHELGNEHIFNLAFENDYRTGGYNGTEGFELILFRLFVEGSRINLRFYQFILFVKTLLYL